MSLIGAILNRIIRDLTWGRARAKYFSTPWYDGRLIIPPPWLKNTQERWEPESRRYLSAHVARGDIAIDIGACVGHYTYLFSRLVGSEGRVFAFEPDPLMFRILQENIKRNSLSNVTALNMAVSDINSKAEFYLSTTGSSSLLPMQGLRSIIQVDVKALDSFEFPRVDWIKIDTEGTEHLILAGARKTLKRCCPRLLIEFLPQFGTTDRLLELLAGWQIHGLDNNILCEKQVDREMA
jgi:FkbM family methyltransferase